MHETGERNHDRSDYGTLNHGRNAAIIAAANLLEAADKAKRLRKRFTSALDLPESDAEPADRRGDFLLDLMRLNANYMNQLATIGKKHGDIANSALEKLYRLLVPAARRDASAELMFDERAAPAEFLVRNDCSPDGIVRFEPRGFIPRSEAADPEDEDKTWLAALEQQGDDPRAANTKLNPKAKYECTVSFGKTSVFVAKIRGDLLPTPRLYSVELVVIMGNKRKTIPVVIDRRAAR